MSIRYRYQIFEVGDVRVQLQLPRDLEQFSDFQAAGNSSDVSDEAFPLFGVVWTSSEILAQLLLNIDIAGKRILEIGCGMALVSHVLNALGADITALDIHPITGDLLNRNTKLNGTKPIPFVSASWANVPEDIGKFDLIVGSDILYEPQHVQTLAPFINDHTCATSEIVIVDPNRGQTGRFESAMVRYGFDAACERNRLNDLRDNPYEGVVYRFVHN